MPDPVWEDFMRYQEPQRRRRTIRCRVGIHLWKVKTKTNTTKREIIVTTYNRCTRGACRYDAWMVVDVEKRPRPSFVAIGQELID